MWWQYPRLQRAQSGQMGKCYLHYPFCNNPSCLIVTDVYFCHIRDNVVRGRKLRNIRNCENIFVYHESINI